MKQDALPGQLGIDVTGVEDVPRRLNPALHSSVKMDWCTPDNVLELVRKVGPIALDPCTTADNPVGAAVFITPDMGRGGLEADWLLLSGQDPSLPGSGGLIYCNPPYGREIGSWVRKCSAEAARGAEVVLLVPARTDTAWMQEAVHVPDGPTVLWWRGRLKFKGAKDSAPFPSALLYWGNRYQRFMRVFEDKGMFT